MKFIHDVVVVVDAYPSTGGHIAPAFKGYGIPAVHVQTTPELNAENKKNFVKTDFVENFIYTGNNFDQIIQSLSEYNVKWVLPGNESGVTLADKISDALQLPNRNAIALSPARRNKYLMHEALKAAGVRSMRHFRSNSLSAINQWVQEQPEAIRYPVVVKPIDSAGTDGVRICKNALEVAEAFDNIYGKKNVFGVINEEVLVQEYLDGKDIEYCVNTVSHDGHHFVSEIIKVYRVKINNIPVHDYNELLCPIADKEMYDKLSGYVFSVLDALGIRYGAGHSELMVVNDKPILLETGARFPGSIDLSAYTKALGYNQLMMVVQACINPEQFLQLIQQPRKPLRYHSSCVFLISDREGVIHRSPDTSVFKSIRDFHSVVLQDQGTLLKTTDLYNTPGRVFVLSKNKEELAQSRQKVRDAEPVVYSAMLKPANARLLCRL